MVGRRRSSPRQAQSEDVGSDSKLAMARPPKRKQTEREAKVLEIMDNLRRPIPHVTHQCNTDRNDCQWHAFQHTRSSKHNHV